MKSLEDVSVMLSMEQGITFCYGNNVINSQANKPVFRQCFNYMGQVKSGLQLGRKWGIPTANLDVDGMYPQIKGIFCVHVRRKSGQLYQGVASLGNRPTVNGDKQVLEIHLFNFNECLYGEILEVFFLYKLRDEIKFSSIDALINQIYDDISRAKRLFPSLSRADYSFEENLSSMHHALKTYLINQNRV